MKKLLLISMMLLFGLLQAQESVQIVTFTATPRSDGNLLKWTVRNEVNVNNYEIYHASDTSCYYHAMTFWVGSNNQTNYYTFLDRNIYDTTYYSIVVNNLDGSFQRIIGPSVVNILDHGVPYIERFKVGENCLQITSRDKIMVVRCYDMSGRLIYQYSMTPWEDLDVVFPKPYICVLYEDGNIVGFKKILK